MKYAISYDSANDRYVVAEQPTCGQCGSPVYDEDVVALSYNQAEALGMAAALNDDLRANLSSEVQ